ncbi:MAG: propanoyl-CoA acyltransferase [Chloroflexi bacterium RBG_13_60_13]|nr:MAG: propanoyl-CoA acyltransferase [Chloroflexi bacterium RBG_13_60_13]
MGTRTAIVGVGQTHHTSKRKDVNGQELISEAVKRALEDAALDLRDIDAIVIGNMDHFEAINNVDGWSVDGSGAFMKPIMKVTTGGSTGGTLGSCAYYHVASGLFDVVMAIGWEKNSESDTQAAISTCADPIVERDFFGGAIGPNAAEYAMYMKQFGATQEDAALVAVRDHNNALRNPHAHLRKFITVEDVMKSPVLCWPIKLLDSCPRSDGACAVIYASETRAPKITPRPAWVHATAVSHDYVYFGDYDWEMMPTLRTTVDRVYHRAGITDPLKDVDVMELYLPFSTCGVVWMDHMRMCGPGEGPKLIRRGVFDINGELPINPSGGVLSTNPIGATALIRIGEAALQVMGKAEERQVSDVRTAMATAFGSCYWFEATVLRSTKP